MRNRPPSPHYCLFLPVALFSKKKEKLSPKIVSELACQVDLKPFFFLLPLVTQVAWQDLEGNAEGGKSELVGDKRIEGGKIDPAAFSARIVVRGKEVNPWSLALC